MSPRRFLQAIQAALEAASMSLTDDDFDALLGEVEKLVNSHHAEVIEA